MVSEEESEGLIGDANSPGLYASRGRSVGPEPVGWHVRRGKPAAPRVAAPAVAARGRAGGRGRGGALVRGRRSMAAGHACAGRGDGTGFHRLGGTARRLAAASGGQSADGRTTGAVESQPAASSSSKQGSRSREQCPVGLAPGRATGPRGVGQDPHSSPRPRAAGHGTADAAVAGDAVASARRSPVGAAAVARTSDELAPLGSGSASRVARTGGRPHWRGDGKQPVLAGILGHGSRDAEGARDVSGNAVGNLEDASQSAAAPERHGGRGVRRRRRRRPDEPHGSLPVGRQRTRGTSQAGRHPQASAKGDVPAVRDDPGAPHHGTRPPRHCARESPEAHAAVLRSRSRSVRSLSSPVARASGNPQEAPSSVSSGRHSTRCRLVGAAGESDAPSSARRRILGDGIVAAPHSALHLAALHLSGARGRSARGPARRRERSNERCADPTEEVGKGQRQAEGPGQRQRG